MCAAAIETAAPLPCGPKRREAPASVRETDDIGLTRRTQAGDEPAFRELVERNQSRILRVVYGILRNRADADEIAQEVFAKVYFSIQSFDCRCTLFTWMYRIAVNESYAWLRKRRVKLVLEGDSADGGATFALQMTADARPTPDRAVAERDFMNKLLARMPEDDRVLLLWKAVEGFSVVQIAEMTGLNENTVKVRLFRARRRLVELAARLSRPAVGRVNSGN